MRVGDVVGYVCQALVPGDPPWVQAGRGVGRGEAAAAPGQRSRAQHVPPGAGVDGGGGGSGGQAAAHQGRC